MAAKRNQRTKRQHYVPRCYLNRFTKDGRTVWAFDKFENKKFSSNVTGVAQEVGFYDLPPDAFGDKHPAGERDSQFAERKLSGLESDLAACINQVVKELETRGLSRALQERLAVHAVIQLLRTREAREDLRDLSLAYHRTMFEKFCEQRFPGQGWEKQCEFVYDAEALTSTHVSRLLDKGHLFELATHLLDYIWVFGVNVTTHPFYTSDHPVVKKAHIHKPGRSFTGVRARGIEIAFPLTSRHILTLYERTHFAHLLPLHGRVRRIDAFGVEHFNTLQVLRSNRWVYCEADQFEQAAGVCRRFPEVCDPKRKRVEVVRSGDVVGFLNRE
jgi:hypothetical protein